MKKIIDWFSDDIEFTFYLVGLVIAIALIVVVLKFQHIRWNDGICPECNHGKYEFVNHSTSVVNNRKWWLSTYSFKCDECGHVEVFYGNPQ